MTRAANRPGRAVFLARDGVLNEDRGAVGRPSGFAWIPDAIGALRDLRAGGWRLVVATHQPGIARGLFGPAEHDNLCGWMRSELARRGVTLDGLYHCPHLPDAPLAAWCRHCECRPPQAGMLKRAARELGLDLAACVLIGAKPDDLLAGRAARVNACVRVTGTTDPATLADAEPRADFTCRDLRQAADWLLTHEKTLSA